MPEPSASARLLLDEGVIDRAQLRYAERVHAKLAMKRPMADVLRELFAIELETVRDVLRKRRTEIRLGELLVELGHLTQDELAQALELQQGATDEKQRLGEVLVDHGFIDESTALGSVKASLQSEGTFGITWGYERIPRMMIQHRLTSISGLDAPWEQLSRLSPGELMSTLRDKVSRLA